MFARIPEDEQIRHFLDAYVEVTGEQLEVVKHRDRPDFLCQRSDGSLVGVEVTIITRNPEMSFFDDVVNANRFMDPMDACDWIFGQVQRKDALRASSGWHFPDHCILLLSLPDCQLSRLSNHLVEEDFQDNGFEEIWIADHSEMEEYGAIELFGLKPLKYWGHHRRDRGKPFG